MQFDEHWQSYKFHWYYGVVGCSLNANDTIKASLEFYQNNTSKLRSDLLQVQRIYNYPRIIRWFYQYFNIENFAKHKMILAIFFEQATKSNEDNFLSLFEGYESMLNVVPSNSQTTSSWSGSTPSFRSSSKTLYSLYETFRTYFNDSQTTRNVDADSDGQLETELPSYCKDDQQDNKNESVAISEAMIQSLQELGLTDLNQGDELYFIVLKNAYRAKARTTHPDKVKDDGKAFVKVKKAYDYLYACILKGDALIEYYKENESEALAKVNRDVEALRQDFRNIAQVNREIARDWSDIQASYREMSQEYSEIGSDFTAVQQGYLAIAQDYVEIGEQCSQLLKSSELNFDLYLTKTKSVDDFLAQFKKPQQSQALVKAPTLTQNFKLYKSPTNTIPTDFFKSRCQALVVWSKPNAQLENIDSVDARSESGYKG